MLKRSAVFVAGPPARWRQLHANGQPEPRDQHHAANGRTAILAPAAASVDDDGILPTTASDSGGQAAAAARSTDSPVRATRSPRPKLGKMPRVGSRYGSPRGRAPPHCALLAILSPPEPSGPAAPAARPAFASALEVGRTPAQPGQCSLASEMRQQTRAGQEHARGDEEQRRLDEKTSVTQVRATVGMAGLQLGWRPQELDGRPARWRRDGHATPLEARSLKRKMEDRRRNLSGVVASLACLQEDASITVPDGRGKGCYVTAPSALYLSPAAAPGLACSRPPALPWCGESAVSAGPCRLLAQGYRGWKQGCRLRCRSGAGSPSRGTAGWPCPGMRG